MMAVLEFVLNYKVKTESVPQFLKHESSPKFARSQEKNPHCLLPFSGRQISSGHLLHRAGEEGDVLVCPLCRCPVSRAGLAQGLSAQQEQQH